MKTLKDIEKEFDDIFPANLQFNEKDIPLIKALYKRRFKEILEEVVGEDDKLPDNPTQHQTAHLMITGHNQAKAEIRKRIAKIIK